MRRPDIPVLTTLRFPAAFAIVLYHFLVLSQCPRWIFEGFLSGVSFFYVLSGFILYYNYCDLPDRSFFWMARVARVWPLHLATLALAFCLLPFSSLDGHEYWPVILPANALLLQAWVPSHSVIFSYNGVAWSLSVEAFFYFSFPWLLEAMRARGSAPVLVGSVILSLVLVAATMLIFPSRAVLVAAINPLCRVFEFISGMIACRLWMSVKETPLNSTEWLGLELVVLTLTVGAAFCVPQIVNQMHLAPPLALLLGTDIIAVGFAIVIWIFAHQKGAISRGLSIRVFERMGEISFAVFMCHQLFIRWLFPQPLGRPSELLKPFLLLMLVVLPASASLFHLVETPSRIAILALYKRRKSEQHHLVRRIG